MRNIGYALAVWAIALAPALAAETLKGPQITATISDATVDGSMVDSGRYTEFYAADGTIRGKDYTGKWSVEGDTMCFAYGTDPKTCWSVGLEGGEVQWIQGGVVKGTGAVTKGNVNKF